MPPRIPYPPASQLRLRQPVRQRPFSSTCLICNQYNLSTRKSSIAQNGHSLSRRLRSRKQSNLSQGATENSQLNPRHHRDLPASLKQALLDVSKHASSYVNISRLQLALRGLDQPTGEETIRVAIIASQVRALVMVKELVRLIIADPLKAEEEWERILTESRNDPVLLKIGEDSLDETSRFSGNRLLQELRISSPTLNSHNLEILVLGTEFSTAAQTDFMEAALVPTLEIPTSSTGRYTPVTTPVHKALIVGDGIKGAAAMVHLSGAVDPALIYSAVNIPGLSGKEEMPFLILNMNEAKASLDLFRESVNNALEYEHGWFSSGLPEVVDWIKAGSVSSGDLGMKQPVLALISSLLEDASNRILQEERTKTAESLSPTVSSTSMQKLKLGLRAWAERAHTELRDQLDVAFDGSRWRKLRWWKLFWRVDDVSMISTDILQRRFLTEAEKEVIYLAGQIDAAGVHEESPNPIKADVLKPAAYGSAAPPPRYRDLINKPDDDGEVSVKIQPWPLNIPSTRLYLALDTVPALQALAQKLVLQTLSTSGFSSAFAALIYVSTLTTSLYEAGAVAAFGIVYSMKRMQKKWETAREFWEGEVREEGRKAVRAVESSVETVLTAPSTNAIEGAEELGKARNAVETAKTILDEFNAAKR